MLGKCITNVQFFPLHSVLLGCKLRGNLAPSLASRWCQTVSGTVAPNTSTVRSLDDTLPNLISCIRYFHDYTRIWLIVLIFLYSSSHRQTARFKATAEPHFLTAGRLSYKYSTASCATVRVSSRLHSPGLRCSWCNEVNFCCDLEAGYSSMCACNSEFKNSSIPSAVYGRLGL
jgi:hypothetical protein